MYFVCPPGIAPGVSGVHTLFDVSASATEWVVVVARFSSDTTPSEIVCSPTSYTLSPSSAHQNILRSPASSPSHVLLTSSDTSPVLSSGSFDEISSFEVSVISIQRYASLLST